MKAGLNKIKIAIISMIVLAMAIGQLELFGKVYAEELEKIKEQDPYGEYYDENINNVHKTSAQIIEKGNPDVITKEAFGRQKKILQDKMIRKSLN